MFAGISQWDIAIERWLDTGRSPFFVWLFSFITALGDARFITVVALAIAVVLLRHRLWRYKLGFAVALFGSIAATEAIKFIVARPRPMPPFPLLDVSGYSFPSMHAAVSLATFGFLAFMVLRRMHPPSSRHVVAGCIVSLPFLIGFSRVYLGVHYPSDVLVGWLVGGLCLYAGILLTIRYNRTI